MLIANCLRKEIDKKCPKCYVGYLKLRKSKYGWFLGCSKYPQCLYKVSEYSIKEYKKFKKTRGQIEIKLKAIKGCKLCTVSK